MSNTIDWNGTVACPPINTTRKHPLRRVLMIGLVFFVLGVLHGIVERAVEETSK